MSDLIEGSTHNDVLLASRVDSSYTDIEGFSGYKHSPIDPCRTGEGGWVSQTYETLAIG